MSLNSEVLESFDALLPAEDSILFKEPDPGPINQDAFSSLDLPDFSNFTVEDVNFGDLEFLDLASVPSERVKKTSSNTGQYFTSLATPSGYCSTNYLTEEANRLSLLLSDCGAYKEKGFSDRNLLDNLEDFFGVGQSNAGDEVHVDPNLLDSREAEKVFDEVPDSENMLRMVASEMDADNSRQVTIKSHGTGSDESPPQGAIAKIIIRTSKKNNFTRFTFATIDDNERNSFIVKTANLIKAINSLKSFNLDSIEVIRRLLRLEPKANRVKSTKIVCESEEREGFVTQVETKTTPGSSEDKLIYQDDEEALKSSLLKYGVKIDNIVRIKILSGQKFWCCPLPDCQKAYGKGYELKLHILAHYNIKPYQCDYPGCSWGFLTKTKLNRHKQSHTKDKTFICTINGCLKSFSTAYNLKTHIQLHNKVLSFQCEHCDNKFSTEKELQLHKGKLHKNIALLFKCPIEGCSKTFMTESNLNTHLKNHKAANSVCDICEKVFDKPSRLKTHMFFHTGERPFRCDFIGCSWTFPTQSKLARHKRTHTKEKKIICHICDKAFGRRDHLRQHLQTHKNEDDDKILSRNFEKNMPSLNQFRCSVIKCGKTHVSKAALRAHQRAAHKDTDEMMSVMLPTVEAHGDDMSAGQLDFVALLSCVDDLQLPVPVQEVVSEEVVSMDTDLLTMTDTAKCSDILFSDTVPPSTINLQDLQ